MNKKLLFIINPKAGRAEIKDYALDTIDLFVRSGFDVTVYTTRKSGDALEYISKNGMNYSRIVCCGGDGTANETLNGIMLLDNRPEFAVIPTGTANDYAFNLNIPSVIPDAAKVAANGLPFVMDVGKFENKYFTYVAAFGLMTEVTYETPQDAKNLFGYIAYLLEGAKRLSSIKTYHVKIECDEGIIEDDYLLGLFSNTTSIAGLRTAFRDSHLDDGLLEAVLIQAPTTLADVQSIINLLLSIEHFDSASGEFLTAVRSKKFVLTSSESIKWTLDGENGGAHKRAVIENMPKAVTAIRGQKKLKG